MDSNVDITRITNDLEKKFNGDANHDIRVIQEYIQTLPPCEESAKLVAALGRYAQEKYPDAEAFKFGKKLEEAIADLEKSFNGDDNHDVEVIQEYCRSLPRNDENLKIVLALGQYAATRFPESEYVKKSKADFEKMNDDANKLKARLDEIQEQIKNKDYEKAVDGLRAIIAEAKFPVDDDKRLVSFSHPFEEILFQTRIQEKREVMRISNLMEMLNLQLGDVLTELHRFDEARDAINHALEFNPVSCHARLELVRGALLDKNYDEAFEQLKEAYPLAFTRQMLAIYYCFLAEVVENLDKNYELAAAYCHVSLDYADNKNASELLNKICEAHKISKDRPTPETVRKLATDAGLPLGANLEVCKLAVSAGRQIKSAHPEIAKQFLAIAYELTGDKALLKEIQ